MCANILMKGGKTTKKFNGSSVHESINNNFHILQNTQQLRSIFKIFEELKTYNNKSTRQCQ